MSPARQAIGHPHLHLAEIDSTNDHARELAIVGAPHGTTISAGIQSGGRGRQGREWESPAGALALSCVLRPNRDVAELLPLAAALATAHICGPQAKIKWPNDIWLLPGRKVAGILVDARPQEGWYVVGVGINVAVDLCALDPTFASRAATLGRPVAELPAWRADLIEALDTALRLDRATLVTRWRERDAIRDQPITWDDGAESGKARGIDDNGHLMVERPTGQIDTLSAGEIHLEPIGYTPA